MRTAIKLALVALLLHPQMAPAKSSPVKVKLNECALWLGFAEEPFKVEFAYVLRAAKSFRRVRVDPAKDHVEGFAALAHQINRALARTAAAYADEDLAKALMAIHAETEKRIAEGRVTYEYMVLLPVRVGLVLKAKGGSLGIYPLTHDNYRASLNFTAVKFEDDRQVLEALERFPSQVLLPAMGLRLTRAEREQLLELKVWPIEVTRTDTPVGGLKINPYALAIESISRANHLSRFSLPKFWTALMPEILDHVRRAEIDNFLNLGTLQPFHQRLFTRNAGSLYVLQRDCSTLECLAGRLHQTDELGHMIGELEGSMVREGVLGYKGSRTRQMAKIYLRAFKTAILSFSRAAMAEERAQNK